MQFVFWLANHSHAGQRSLEDVIMIMGAQLQALGHRAVWKKDNQCFVTKEHGLNILVEGFTDASINIMADYHAQGARFVILATEEPTPRGFNHGIDQEMVRRQQRFPEAAKYAEAIWHLVPGKHVTDWYGQFAPTAPVELGYAHALLRPRITDCEPTYDFGFYGSLTRRRHQILKRLANRTGKHRAIRVVNDFATQAERDQAMREARVIVQIRKEEKMGLVSSSRCNTALMIGRPVIAEPHELSKPWDEVVRFSQSLEKFYDEAMILRGPWRGIHRDQFDKFRDKLSPVACVGPALAQIGI